MKAVGEAAGAEATEARLADTPAVSRVVMVELLGQLDGGVAGDDLDISDAALSIEEIGEAVDAAVADVTRERRRRLSVRSSYGSSSRRCFGIAAGSGDPPL